MLFLDKINNMSAKPVSEGTTTNMKIAELIEHIKEISNQAWNGKPIEVSTTRDQILYGTPEAECTGVVTTCYASVAVIQRAGKLGCNFIIVHESLFWNHGDHTDWLSSNTAFQKKRALLDKYHICIWRCHDYIHAGLPVDGIYRDGIFYGMSSLLNWNDYMDAPDTLMPQRFHIPECTVFEMARLLTDRFHLDGVRFIGNPHTRIREVYVPLHIMGHSGDSKIISKINDENINCLITLEMVDFTVCEYIRDAAMMGEDRCIFALGHFNMEEIGMEYFAGYISEKLFPELPVHFIQSGDAYGYIPV